MERGGSRLAACEYVSRLPPPVGSAASAYVSGGGDVEGSVRMAVRNEHVSQSINRERARAASDVAGAPGTPPRMTHLGRPRAAVSRLGLARRTFYKYRLNL